MNKLKILLTIDTEVWSFYGDDIEKNIDSAMYGITEYGEFGLNYQLNLFKEHNLKAVFFVEPFFTLISGEKPLQSIVHTINSYDQEIGLHVHTEWFSRCEETKLPVSFQGNNIKDNSLNDQDTIINKGLNILKSAGSLDVNSFRAGNYGANNDTLKALKINNIDYDTSYNTPYLNRDCDVKIDNTATQPIVVNGILEFPITHFVDYPGHIRHLQITACSYDELKFVIDNLWEEQQEYCVIVLHSSEWITRKKDKQGNKTHKLDKICMERFRKLCQYLDSNRDKFETINFKDVQKESLLNKQPKPIESNILRTGLRFLQQLRRKML